MLGSQGIVGNVHPPSFSYGGLERLVSFRVKNLGFSFKFASSTIFFVLVQEDKNGNGNCVQMKWNRLKRKN